MRISYPLIIGIVAPIVLLIVIFATILFGALFDRSVEQAAEPTPAPLREIRLGIHWVDYERICGKFSRDEIRGEKTALGERLIIKRPIRAGWGTNPDCDGTFVFDEKKILTAKYSVFGEYVPSASPAVDK